MRTAFAMRHGFVLYAILVGVLGSLIPVRSFAAEEKQSAPPPKTDGAYRLRAGDEVLISVLPRKEYECGGVILPDGALYLKNVGPVKAVGMTLPELSDYVFQVLNKKLVEPKVLATLVRAAPEPMEKSPVIGKVTVVGAVTKTGPVDLEEGLRVRKALDLAGGTLADADLSRVAILHRDLTRTTVDLSKPERLSDPAHNRVLTDGDSIEVTLLPPAPKGEPSARITGQVVNPGQYPLKAGMTLEDLIVAAGKLTPLARVEEIQLQHRGQAVQTVDLVEQQKLGLQGKVLLQVDDEVFIPEQRDVVLVIGAVTSPGAKRLIPGQTVREFFLNGTEDLASALNPAVINLGDVQLIRRGKQPLKLDLKQIIKKPKREDNVALQGGDVLFLPPKEQKSGGPLSFLQQLGPLGLLMSVF